MRKLLALLSAALFCAGCFVLAHAQETIIGGGVTGMYKASGGGGSPSVKQTAHAINTVGAPTTLTATFGAGTSAGSIIAVAAEWASSGNTGTISDNNSDAVTDSGVGPLIDGNNNQSVVKAFLSPTTGTTSVTLTLTGGVQFIHLAIWEIAGLSSKTFDQVAHANGLQVTSATTGTLAQANEVGIAYAETSNNSFTSASLTASPGTFTLDYNDTVGGTASNQAGHTITAATTALTASITIGFNYDTIWMVTFK